MTKCPKCNESMSLHMIPYSQDLRSCEEAKKRKYVANPEFCRRLEECNGKSLCQNMKQYGRSCND